MKVINENLNNSSNRIIMAEKPCQNPKYTMLLKEN